MNEADLRPGLARRLGRVQARRAELARDFDVACGRFYRLDLALAAQEAALADAVALLASQEEETEDTEHEGA